MKYAFGTLARTPGFTLVAVLTLALGIGATTAIFSVVHGVLMKPLPYRDPERLANIWVDLGVGNQSLPAVSPGDFRDYQQRSRLFESFAAGSGPSLIGATGALAASDGRETERIDVTPVSANFFSLLGVDPMLGRHFLPGRKRREVRRSPSSLTRSGRVDSAPTVRSSGVEFSWTGSRTRSSASCRRRSACSCLPKPS